MKLKRLKAAILAGAMLPGMAAAQLPGLPMTGFAAGGAGLTPFYVLGFELGPWQDYLARELTPSYLAESDLPPLHISWLDAEAVSILPAFAVQLGLVLVTSGMPLLIAAELGAEELPPFAVTQRLLWLPTMLVGVMVYPLWPAYREALARGDWAFLGSGLRRSFVYAGLIQIPFLLLMLVEGEWIIDIIPTNGLPGGGEFHSWYGVSGSIVSGWKAEPIPRDPTPKSGDGNNWTESDNVMTIGPEARHFISDTLDPFGAAHRGAAIFLHKEGHDSRYPS